MWRWREKEQEEAWFSPSALRPHRNVKVSLILLEDSLQKIRKFTFKFRVCICRKSQVMASHLQGRDSSSGPAPRACLTLRHTHFWVRGW